MELFKNITLGVFGALLVACIIIILFTNKSEENEKVQTVDTQGVMIERMKENFVMEKAAEAFFWELRPGEPLEEQDLMAQFNAVTPRQQRELSKNLLKEGAKRYKETCYNMASEDSLWSAGYCYTVDAPPVTEVS